MKLYMAEKRKEKERRTKTETKPNRMIDVSSVILELMNSGTVHVGVPQVKPSSIYSYRNTLITTSQTGIQTNIDQIIILKKGPLNIQM
jgi:hypothetical protein